MRLVETYLSDPIPGTPWPSLGLIEDDDGARSLVVAAPIPSGVAEEARRSGAMGAWCRVQDHWRWQPWTGAASDWPEIVSYRHLVTDSAKTTPFVHLHAHSEFSALDGLSTVEEMVEIARADHQPAIALTDHGVVAGHPTLSAATAKAGIKPIYGLEAYLVADRLRRPDPKPTKTDLGAFDEPGQALLLEGWHAQTKEIRDYYHLVLWAQDQAGLKNLWALSTQGYLDGFYTHPRIDWAALEAHQEGLLASTACLRGPVAHELLRGRDDLATSNLGRLLGIFGDRLYAELHTNQLDIQRQANEWVVDAAQRHGIPLIAVTDSHYPCKEDQIVHKVWLAAQTKKDLHDESDLFAGSQDYHLMAADEVRGSFSYLPSGLVEEAMSNTVAVADRCDAGISRRVVAPIFSRRKVTDDERRADDVRRLTDLCVSNWGRIVAEDRPQSVYIDRFEREMKLLVDRDFCGYFLMVADQVSYAKERLVLVGPSRGSGGGSLVAYLCEITELDPVKYDLLFERFLTEGRDGLPDFDMDYPTSKRDMMQDFCSQRWGDEHVVRVGTQLRLKNRGTFQDLARIFRDDVNYGDFVTISKIIEAAEVGEAGLGLDWDGLWAQAGDLLEPFRAKYPQIFVLAERMVGRLKSYGRHAAGLVIAPDEDLTLSLPMRSSEQSHQMISQFDMTWMEYLGYVKFDLLTLRTLDTLQECIDLVAERTGERVGVYGWGVEYDDPEVWDQVCAGRTLGIFQIETKSGTRLVKRFKPRSLGDLADVITLVRPGPVRSGLTETYLRRRDGREEVSYVDPRLAEVLAPTQGVPIYQEQIMQMCQVLAGYSLAEADDIRKILGKKKVEKVEAAGVEFVERAIGMGMDRAAAIHVWEQMAEFARYGFGRSHAYAYAMIGVWTAWFRFHYPAEYLTAALSTVQKDRIPDFIVEARRDGYQVLPPDVNLSGKGFTVSGTTIRYGLDSVKGISDATAEAIVAGQPYLSFDDFLTRKGKANLGAVETLVSLGCFTSLDPNRRALTDRLSWLRAGKDALCVSHDPKGLGPGGLPCSFDWSSEPVEITPKTGKAKKPKPPPKRCTKACRHYTPVDSPSFAGVEDYTAAEIRQIEMDLLGISISSTPFDRLPPDVYLATSDAEAIAEGPNGVYRIVGTMSRIRPHTDKSGRKMGFLSIQLPDDVIDVSVFSKSWDKFHRDFHREGLFLASVVKNDRGCNLTDYVAVPD